jgi:hypothetical protein
MRPRSRTCATVQGAVRPLNLARRHELARDWLHASTPLWSASARRRRWWGRAQVLAGSDGSCCSVILAAHMMTGISSKKTASSRLHLSVVKIPNLPVACRPFFMSLRHTFTENAKRASATPSYMPVAFLLVLLAGNSARGLSCWRLCAMRFDAGARERGPASADRY